MKDLNEPELTEENGTHIFTLDRECKNENHVQRDNAFGVTWCIRCGRLFNKPSDKPLTEKDSKLWNVLFRAETIDFDKRYKLCQTRNTNSQQ
jgi:hypothetical protein